MKQILLIVVVLSLAGCVGSLFTQAPRDDAGEPVVARDTVTVLNPAIEERVDVVLGVWCGNLGNLRRILLRVIHVVDPEWQTVCQARSSE